MINNADINMNITTYMINASVILLQVSPLFSFLIEVQLQYTPPDFYVDSRSLQYQHLLLTTN